MLDPVSLGYTVPIRYARGSRTQRTQGLVINFSSVRWVEHESPFDLEAPGSMLTGALIHLPYQLSPP